MIGNFDSTSTWYILIMPELTCSTGATSDKISTTTCAICPLYKCHVWSEPGSNRCNTYTCPETNQDLKGPTLTGQFDIVQTDLSYACATCQGYDDAW